MKVEPKPGHAGGDQVVSWHASHMVKIVLFSMVGLVEDDGEWPPWKLKKIWWFLLEINEQKVYIKISYIVYIKLRLIQVFDIRRCLLGPAMLTKIGVCRFLFHSIFWTHVVSFHLNFQADRPGVIVSNSRSVVHFWPSWPWQIDKKLS